MKKILYFFIILLISCSSDETSSDNNSSTNRISVNNVIYEFDKCSVERIIADEDTFYYKIIFSNTLTGDLLISTLYLQRSPSNLSTTPIPLYSTTYSFDNNIGRRLENSILLKRLSANNYSTIFSDADFIGTLSRISVLENSVDNYSFDLNFVTTLGQVNGTYSGMIERINFN